MICPDMISKHLVGSFDIILSQTQIFWVQCIKKNILLRLLLTSHQFHGMSPHDMSRHGEQKSSWLFWYYSLSNSNLLYSVNKKTLDQVGFCCSVVYLFSTRRKWKWGPRSWNFWYSVFLYSVFVLWSSEATEESDLVLIMCGHLENSYNCMHRSHGYYP